MNAFKLDRSVQRQVNSIERMFKKELRAVNLPKNGSWLAIAGLAAAALVGYLIITNKDIASPPVPIADPFIDELGDLIPGVEGIADDTFIEDLPIGSSAPSKDGAYVSAEQAESMAAELTDRLSVA